MRRGCRIHIGFPNRLLGGSDPGPGLPGFRSVSGFRGARFGRRLLLCCRLLLGLLLRRGVVGLTSLSSLKLKGQEETRRAW